jgi:hypothetical protein
MATKTKKSKAARKPRAVQGKLMELRSWRSPSSRLLDAIAGFIEAMTEKISVELQAQYGSWRDELRKKRLEDEALRRNPGLAEAVEKRRLQANGRGIKRVA